MQFDSPEMKEMFNQVILCTNESQDADVKYWHARYKASCDKLRSYGIELSVNTVNDMMQQVREFCEARYKYCGVLFAEPYTAYKDLADRRRYLNEQVRNSNGRFAKVFLKVFQENVGIVKLNSTRIKVYHNILSNMLKRGKNLLKSTPDSLKRIENVYYLTRAEELLGTDVEGNLAGTVKDAVRVQNRVTGEFPLIANQIKKSSTKDGRKIVGLFPTFSAHGKEYTWDVCRPIAMDYFPHIMPVEEKYTLYYFKPSMLATKILISCLNDVNYEQGERMYRNLQGIDENGVAQTPQGFLYKSLTPEFENSVLGELFDGTYRDQDGFYVKFIKEYERNVLKRIEGDTTGLMNVYTHCVSARAETIMGIYLGAFMDEVQKHDALERCNVFYVNQDLLVIKYTGLYPWETLDCVAPENAKFFKKVSSSFVDALVNKRI